MSKFKSVLTTLGKMADAHVERNNQIDDMSRELMRRSHGVDPVEARKIAAVLVDRAEVTWK